MTAEQLDALRAQVTAALASVAAAHKPATAASDTRPEYVPCRVTPAATRPPRRQADTRRAPDPAMRAPRAVGSVPPELRKLDGRHATVTFDGVPVRVYIHQVESRSTGIKAYVMRLDTRQRQYVLPDTLQDIGDDA